MFDGFITKPLVKFHHYEQVRIDELKNTYYEIVPYEIVPYEKDKSIFEEALWLNNCGEKELSVVPKTHDEFNIQYENPFKRPNKNKVWRLDISKINNNKIVELISPFTISEYKIRYIKYPKPIIISDLNISFPNENLTINGFSSIQQCELDQEIHNEILDRAVELVLREYKPSNLESKILVDNRKE